MKCLFIASVFPPAIGGSASVYANLCRNLAGSVSVIAPSRGYIDQSEFPGWREADAAQPFRVERLDLLRPPLRPPPRSIWHAAARFLFEDRRIRNQVTRRVFAEIERERPSAVVIGELFSLYWLGTAVRRRFGLPIVHYIHGEEVTTGAGSRLANWSSWRALRRAEKVIAVSSFTARELRARGIAQNRIEVIANGVDIDRFTPGPSDIGLLNRFGLRGKRVLLTVGRLEIRKGHDRVIESLPLILEKHPDLVYMVVGSGKTLDALRSLAELHGVSDRVIFVGAVSDSELISFYRTAEVFIMANRTLDDGDTEGFGLVFLEAGACRKPVIGGNAGGVPDAVSHGQTGLLVDGNSPVEIAAACCSLLDDPSLATRLAEAGLQRARESSWKSKTAQFERACLQPPEEPPPGPTSRSIYKAILTHSGAYSIAVILERAAGFILLPLYTHFMSPADYGLMELLDMTSAVVTMLIGLRLGHALFYFYECCSTPEMRDRYTSTAFGGAILIGAAVGLIGCLGAHQISYLILGNAKYASYFWLLFLSFGFSLPQEIGFSCLRAANDSKKFVVWYVCRFTMALVLNATLVIGFRLGPKGLLWSSLATSLTFALALTSSHLSRIEFVMDWQYFRDLSRYSMPLVFSALAMFLIHFGDRFFLQHYVTLSELGIYAIAYKTGMMISYAAAPFNTYWRSQMFALVRTPQGEAVYARVATYLALGLVLIALPLAFLAKPAVALLLDKRYQECAVYIPWVALAYLFREMADYFRNGLLLGQSTALEARVTTISALCCFVAYALLIPTYHVWGAVLATNITFLILLATSVREAQRVRPFAFEFRRLGRLAACSLAAVALFAIAPVHGTAMQIVWGASLAILFVILLAATGFLVPEERRMFRTLAMQFRLPGTARAQ